MKINSAENKRKKIVITVIIVIFMVFVLLLILNFAFDKLSPMIKNIIVKPEPIPNIPKYHLYEPDYDSNIFENEEYINKNRYIEFTDGAVSITITDNSFDKYGKPLEFFNEYFTALMNGEYEKYNSFFTDEYYTGGVKPLDKFTMQKIYNINVTKMSQTVIESGINMGVVQYIFKVSYMIMENDGTFRSDMGSDGAVPQMMEIYYYSDSDICLINKIARYTYIIPE